MSDKFSEFLGKLQKSPTVLSGQVISVKYDSHTGRPTSVSVNVNSNIITLPVGPDTTGVSPGDITRIVQGGSPSQATFSFEGVQEGTRPTTGTFLFPAEVPVGGQTYQGGDMVIGDLEGGNIWIEYETGNLHHRIGTDIYGIEYANGKQTFGAEAGPHIAIDPSVSPAVVAIRAGAVNKIVFDSAGDAFVEDTLSFGAAGELVASNVILNAQGLLVANSAGVAGGIGFTLGAEVAAGFIFDNPSASVERFMVQATTAIDGHTSQVRLYAASVGGANFAALNVNSEADGGEVYIESAGLRVDGDLRVVRSSVTRGPGYIFVPMLTRYDALSAASRSGAGGNAAITLDNTKVPADAKAVAVQVVCKNTVAGDAGYYFVGSASSGNNRFEVGMYSATTNNMVNNGICNCVKVGSNATIYETYVPNTGTMTVSVIITGYFI